VVPAEGFRRPYGAPVADLAAAAAAAPSEHRLTALASEWLLNLRVEGRSPRTLRWYRHHIDAYLGAGGVDDLSSLTAAELRRYVCELQDRGLSDNSVRGAFLSLRCMCNWAARESSSHPGATSLVTATSSHLGRAMGRASRSAHAAAVPTNYPEAGRAAAKNTATVRRKARPAITLEIVSAGLERDRPSTT
jgi:site-specific recombinase XerC